MQSHNTICPVCTLYLREGITLQAHLDTHPKEQVIEALLKVSNGGSLAPAHYPPPTSANPYLPLHPSSPYSHLSHPSPYVNPQASSLTTAVTYQHFMTSNGSSLLPHYVQVPSPGTSSVLSNPAMNYVPSSSGVNYAHTLYNPLYNPYIPQPYPFTPPLLSGYPLSSLPPIDSNTETVSQESNLTSTVNTAQTGTIQTDVVVKMCTVATSTEDNKRVTKNSGSKKPGLKTSTANKRAKILRQKKSDSAVKKSVKSGAESDANESKSSSTSTSTSSSTSSVETTTVIRALRPTTIAATAASVAASTTNKSRITSPPPLQLVASTATRSSSEPMTPPPPPPPPPLLAKAPYFMPRILSCIKSEDVPDCARPQSVSTIISEPSDSSSNLSYEFVGHRKISTVIVENSNSVQSSLSEIRDVQQTEEGKEQEEDEDALIEVVDTEMEPSKDPLSTEPSEEITIDEDTSKLKECPEEEDEEEEEEEEEVRRSEQEEETTIDVDDRQEKIFYMIEVEENKVDLSSEDLNEDIPREMGNENINRTGSRSYVYKEDSSSDKTNTNYPEFVGVDNVQSDDRAMDSRSESRTPSNEFGYFNREYSNLSCDSNRSVITENIRMRESSIRGPDNSSLTYTDLQPAKPSKNFRELEVTRSLNFNNFAEVDALNGGIKIVFNNQSSNPPSDHLGKMGCKLRGGSGPPGFLKSEHQGSHSPTIVDSVIQIVASNGESKGEFTFRDSYPGSSSHISSESHLDNSEMSPLALNIQADESMPARGELSEQESLGAENTTWNLYHGSNAMDSMKSMEEWRNENAQSVSVIGTKKSSKAFRCSICSEVFSCPKERRVHKNTVHVTKSSKMEKGSPTKKAKNFECNFCFEVFASVRDRKQHVAQNHVLNMKNRKNGSNEIKMENAEPEYMNVIVSPDGSAPTAQVKNETEQEHKFKTEISNVTTTSVITTMTTSTTISTTTIRSIPTPTDVDPHRMKYCSKCSLPFEGTKKLREHLRLAHGEVRFKCDKCSACFDEEPEYNDHLLVHPLVCEKCGKTFHRKPNLNLHMKRHLEVKPYECSLCPKSFITRQKLEEHMNGHSGKKPIKCSLCDKTFSRHSNLIQHRNLHHFNVRKKLKDYVCRCGEVFHSMKKLEWHKEIHDRKPKPCPFCSQKFIHSASVTRHIRRSHVPEYLPGDNRELDNVNCPICEKVYLRSSLVVHLRVHNGEKPFQCKICNKRFSTKWNLELHNWTHQSRNNMPYKCHICKSAFFREPDFVAHLNSHRNYKPFTCNICGQKFIRKYSCLRHQEEHKKTKQFVCAVSGCEKSFHRGYYLRDHMKVHTGLRPHTCHICGKASSTKSNHNKHVRIHDTREPVNTEN